MTHFQVRCELPDSSVVLLGVEAESITAAAEIARSRTGPDSFSITAEELPPPRLRKRPPTGSGSYGVRLIVDGHAVQDHHFSESRQQQAAAASFLLHGWALQLFFSEEEPEVEAQAS